MGQGPRGKNRVTDIKPISANPPSPLRPCPPPFPPSRKDHLEDDTSAERAMLFFAVSRQSSPMKMTLSSVFLRLLIFSFAVIANQKNI
jgi:hypothetical protein